MRFVLKLGLILISLAMAQGAIVQRVAAIGWTADLAAYLLLFALAVAGIAAAACIAAGPVRWTLATLFALGALVVDGFEVAAADHMTYEAFLNLLDARGFVADAMAQHGRSGAWAGLKAALLFLGVGLRPGPRPALPRWAALGTPLLVGLLLTAMLFVRGGEGGRGLPGAYLGPSYAVLAGYEALIASGGARAPVALPRGPRAQQGDIVLIVDESVAGQYLDINNPDGVRSGLADRPGVHNFGLAAAITNCSTGTNLSLRYGGSREDYRRINASGPSLWAYARAAGMRSVYIDAQRTHRATQNQMRAAEVAEIDEWVQFDGVPMVERDQAVARALADRLNNGRAEFIFVNKLGAHFPVADKYPPDHGRYRPALPRGGTFADMADTGAREGLDGSGESWRRYRNAYRNTLLWNVGTFFDRLFEAADLAGATLIYTADHGQVLHGRGRRSTITHCGSDPADEEAVVPLVVIAGSGQGQGQGQAPAGAAPSPDWAAAAERARNASSHYRIFPTILGLMGYRPDAVERAYGPPLQSPVPDPFTFNRQFHARLGRTPEWQRIDLDAIPTPPVADYR